jgi:hypothetical protein
MFALSSALLDLMGVTRTGLGDKDHAFAWFEKADEDRSRGMDHLNLNLFVRCAPLRCALCRTYQMGRSLVGEKHLNPNTWIGWRDHDRQ